jgi:hypothetical protein
VSTFGGDPAAPGTTTDLIAFSAAVLNCLNDLVDGTWELAERDAVDEIREAYLRKIGDGEIRNLMRLASLAEAELPLTEDALADPRAGFAVSTRKLGLVFREEVGLKNRTIQFRLAHSALGRLLLAAAFDPVDPIAEQRSVALAHPAVGFALARRLEVAGQPENCRALLAQIMDDPLRLLELGSLQDSYAALRLVQQFDAMPLDKIASALSHRANRGRLIARALVTPLVGLQTFLIYAAKTKELKDFFHILVEELGKEEHRERLIQSGLATPLAPLQSFLVYAEKTDHLRPLATALVLELGKEQHRRALVERGLSSQLGALPAFLAYAESKDALGSLFEALTAELCKAKWQTGLVERAFQMPPTAFPRFLKYALRTKGLASLAKALVAELSKEDNRHLIVQRAWLMNLGALQSYMTFIGSIGELQRVFETLCLEIVNQRQRVLELALQTPLSGIQSFFLYTHNVPLLKPAFEALVADLSKDEYRVQLARRIEMESIGDLTRIGLDDRTRSFWNSVVLAVNDEEWQRNRLRRYDFIPDQFVGFQRYVTAVGRPTLAASLALDFIRRSRPRDWHRDGIGLHNLSHVLRCAVDASDEDIQRFLEKVVTEEWLDEQFVTRATAGSLAGSLLSLTVLAPHFRKLFVRPTLRARVNSELTLAAQRGPLTWVETLSLLGSSAAIGLELQSVDTDWPREDEIVAILDLRTQSPEWSTIGPLQIQLWLGLRTMTHLRNDEVRVPSAHGDAVLLLWLSAYDERSKLWSTHVREANADMIALGLIRFRGHFPKGGYDVQNGIKQRRKTGAPSPLARSGPLLLAMSDPP